MKLIHSTHPPQALCAHALLFHQPERDVLVMSFYTLAGNRWRRDTEVRKLWRSAVVSSYTVCKLMHTHVGLVLVLQSAISGLVCGNVWSVNSARYKHARCERYYRIYQKILKNNKS